MSIHLCSKSLIIKKNYGKIFLEPILGPFKIGLILSILLYSKQQKLLNQNLFQNILKVKAVQNRPQNIRKVRQFYICITNCFMTIQSGVNFVIVLQICFMSVVLFLLNVFIIQIFF